MEGENGPGSMNEDKIKLSALRIRVTQGFYSWFFTNQASQVVLVLQFHSMFGQHDDESKV
ncbi:unnamed protein product [marine sediment metagenome]|uniref:Uncharacterized protein n=1 Tax=marine sediment metagenome TaxID=412755 RepID=X1AQ96_9ZZZZ